MKSLFLPLVDWGMGTFIIGVFAVVCVIIIAVIYNLSRSKDTVPDTNEDTTNKKI